MAFASQEDVFAVLEDVLPPIFAKYVKYDTASKAPFARIGYKEAMERYGSDKPDLRISLVVDDLSDAVQGCGFEPFEGSVVKAVLLRPFLRNGRITAGELPIEVEARLQTGLGFGGIQEREGQCSEQGQ